MAVATGIVKNSYGDTMGFIIDGQYIPYYGVLGNIQMVSNLTADKDGVIKPQDGTLPVASARDINGRKSDGITKENRLERDIRHDLLKWKNKWNKYVLYLTGARQKIEV